MKHFVGACARTTLLVGLAITVAACSEVAITEDQTAVETVPTIGATQLVSVVSTPTASVADDWTVVSPERYERGEQPDSSVPVTAKPKAEQAKSTPRANKPQTKKPVSRDIKSGEWVAKIDKSEQRMRVYRDGQLIHKWKVSTGRTGDATPNGSWNVLKHQIYKDYYSTKYDSPMPYSVFFHGNLAVHGTAYTHRLGVPSSRGCIRLAPENARKFFKIASVQKDRMRITVHQ